MLKLSQKEVQACIQSVLQLKMTVTSRPFLVCQRCRLHMSSTTITQRHTHQTLNSLGHGAVCWTGYKPRPSGLSHVFRAQYLSTSTENTPDSGGKSKTREDSLTPKIASVEKVSSSGPNNDTTKDSDASVMAAAAPSTESQEDSPEEDKKDGGDASSKSRNKLLRIIPRPRKPSPMDYSYTGNIYILPQRALLEYLLKPSDLEELPKYTRRSPYADGKRITLYLRSDVEEVALTKWGTFDLLNKEKARFRGADGHGRYEHSDWRSILNDISAPGYINPDSPDSKNAMEKPDVHPQETTFLRSGSTKVVISAIIVNAANSLFKGIAWLYTGSHSMFAEFVHSCADTMNQVILGIGLYHSFKKPDTDHPYGYRNLRHISSLISGVGIFFLGTGVSWYHSLQGFMNPTELVSLHWCIATLVGSFLSEGATLAIAINQVKKSCKANNMGFVEYLVRAIDPNVNVVLLEDLAAVVGVGVAGTCITISHLTGSHLADASGSAIIGTLLGGVAAFIIHTNVNQLVGMSIPLDERQDISGLLEKDRMIRSLHDIKATQMGGLVRYKAEVDFDGKEITRAYLYKQDLELMLVHAQQLQTVDELEKFMLDHGEKVIDTLGEEVDRIEKALKIKHPEIRHVDLEAL